MDNCDSIIDECNHDWSEMNMNNYECTQCTYKISSRVCKYCYHDDAIRCTNQYQCIKCGVMKGSLEQSLEYRAYRDVITLIRNGYVDPSNPISIYIQKCIDLQKAYHDKRQQDIIDRRNEALLKHIQLSK